MSLLKIRICSDCSHIGHREQGRTVWNEGWPEFQIDGADEAFILLSIATDYETKDPLEFSVKQIDRLSGHYTGFPSIERCPC